MVGVTKLLGVAAAVVSIGTVGSGIYLGNLPRDRVKLEGPQKFDNVVWEHISIGENGEKLNGKYEKQCWRQLREVFSTSIVLNTEEFEQPKSEHDSEEGIQFGCGYWANNIGNLNRPQEIFRGNKGEVNDLLKGSIFEKKVENTSPEAQQQEAKWTFGENGNKGECNQKDLGGGKIEIVCQKIENQIT
ncbi:hypothetical protein [Mycoplasma suis]|uniref:Uncharacterized protein n=1 Tax=Mycoplasma suis (strain Illinois) TaxID=768700 RepID=F0QQ64_MYCSL|nr:hypothetical protein [Mycoplasma suis]ADX97634.1 hypothetical protein MSU_0090 [Mycoplasma suis str. Illinois]